MWTNSYDRINDRRYLYIYFFTLIILNSSTQVLLLLYKCPKAIIFIYYGGIDLIKLIIAFNDPP